MTPEFAGMILLFVVSINLVSFLAFVMDKRRSVRGAWRISERTLLRLAFFGGSFGAFLGQSVFKHKTYKQPFGNYLNAIGMLHLAIVALMFIPAFRNLFPDIATVERYLR